LRDAAKGGRGSRVGGAGQPMACVCLSAKAINFLILYVRVWAWVWVWVCEGVCVRECQLRQFFFINFLVATGWGVYEGHFGV